MLYPPARKSLFVALCSVAIGPVANGAPPASSRPTEGKELLIPRVDKSGPEDNDYANPDSTYCYRRSRMTDHFALFWAKEYGEAPKANPNPKRRFDPDRVLAESERYYRFYVDTLKWFGPQKSNAEQYKMVIYVTGGDNGTAYGSAKGAVGLFWTPASRINAEPYGVVAHELGHSFQTVLRSDGRTAFSGSKNGAFFEMTSQYMLWQVLPEWMTFENYHLRDFMKRTHLAFLHEDNAYHSPYVLEYWSMKHGQPFIGKLWRESKKGEDPVQTYQRITSVNQKQFNDEMFDAARRFITWDLPRVQKVAAKYANQHTTEMTEAGNGWFQIAPARCPQNYGYNGIKLTTPAQGTKVTLEFKGTAGVEGFRSIKPELAGWRYGFVAVKEDGSRVYAPAQSDSDGKSTFVVPARTKYLWLVVLGAPTQHWIHDPDKKEDTDEQWPYRIKLTGTTLDASVFAKSK